MLAGRIIAGPHVRASCRRHLRDLKEGPGRGLVWRFYADPAGDPDPDPVPGTGFWACSFFRDALCLTGGQHEGRPFVLEPWQAFVVGSLFGWQLRDGTRRFRVAFVLTGKGSGKSPLAAGIGILGLCADGEARAEIYSAASDKDQASILFRDAVAMCKRSTGIAESVRFSGGEGREYNIAYPETHSFFRPVSSESTGRGKSGFRPHIALLDEVHEHPTNAMVEFMRAGTKGRRQALIFMITNAGVDRTSVCYEQQQRGEKVAAGDLEDDSAFSYICACDEGEDPITDPADPELGYPKSWAKTNPSIGVTFEPRYLREQVREAHGMPGKESIVRRLNFCQWVDAANPWIDGDLWRACEVDDVEHVGPTFLALDLSGKRDLTAAARVSIDEEGVIHAEVRAWTPADTLAERERLDRVPYGAWVRDGHLIAVPGRSIDYAFVVRDLAEWLGSATALAFDPYRIDDFLRELDDVGIDAHIRDEPDTSGPGIALVRHGQGFGGGASEATLWMPRSIGALEEAVLQGRFRVKRNPALTWASASAVLQSDAAGNRKWEKRKSTGRIDPIVAVSMGVGVAAHGNIGESVYEERGLVML